MDIATKVRLLTTPNNLELLPEPPPGSNQTPRIKEEYVDGGSYLTIDGFVALPVRAVSSEYDTSSPLQVFDPSNKDIAILLFTKSIHAFNIARLTYTQLAAYLTEIDLSSTLLGSDYKFNYDYLVMEIGNLSQYINNYSASAPLWGRFCHSPLPTLPYKNSNPKIKIFDADFSKSTFADSVINQAINQYFPAERFLKLYHVLESDFDYIIVDKLKNITISNSPVILGELINSFGKSEYEKLFFMLNERINDLNSLVDNINLVLLHQAKAETIFYTFSKSTNPLKDITHFKAICLKGGFAQTNFTGIHGLNITTTLYRAFIIKLVSYWIYRVRCCIAHKRIGEYMISTNDEDLLVEFAEPLIREVLRQYLS